MCLDWIKAKWKLFRDSIRLWLVKLGNIPLCRVVGRRDYYGGKIQIPYDLSKEEAEKEIAIGQAKCRKMDRRKLHDQRRVPPA